MASSPGPGIPASATIIESPVASAGENFLPRQLCEPGPTVHALAAPNPLLTNPANVPFTSGALMMIVRSRVPACCRRYQSTPHALVQPGTKLSRGSTSQVGAGLRNSTDADAVPRNGRRPSRTRNAGPAAGGGGGVA